MTEFFNDVFNIVTEHYPFLLRGIGYTMLIAMVGTLAGLLIGLATGVFRASPMAKNPVLRFLQRVVNGLIAVYVEIFRGTPMMVQAMFIYFGALQYTSLKLSMWSAAFLIVSITYLTMTLWTTRSRPVISSAFSSA